MTAAMAQGTVKLMGSTIGVNFDQFHRAVEIIDDDGQYATSQFIQACDYLTQTLGSSGDALKQLINPEKHDPRLKRCQSAIRYFRVG